MGHEQRKSPWRLAEYDVRTGLITTVEERKATHMAHNTDWLFSPNKIARVRIRKVTLKNPYDNRLMLSVIEEVIVRENGFCQHASFVRYGQRTYLRQKKA